MRHVSQFQTICNPSPKSHEGVVGVFVNALTLLKFTHLGIKSFFQTTNRRLVCRRKQNVIARKYAEDSGGSNKMAHPSQNSLIQVSIFNAIDDSKRICNIRGYSS